MSDHEIISTAILLFPLIQEGQLLVIGKSMMFVCVDVLRPSQPNRVMSSAISLPNHMFTGQA